LAVRLVLLGLGLELVELRLASSGLLLALALLDEATAAVAIAGGAEHLFHHRFPIHHHLLLGEVGRKLQQRHGDLHRALELGEALLRIAGAEAGIDAHRDRALEHVVGDLVDAELLEQLGALAAQLEHGRVALVELLQLDDLAQHRLAHVSIQTRMSNSCTALAAPAASFSPPSVLPRLLLSLIVP
jgi:hypothetical protein